MNIEQMNKNGTIDNWLDLKKYINEYVNENYPLTQEDLRSIVNENPSENVVKRQEAHRILNDEMKQIINEAAEENKEVLKEYANGNFTRTPYSVKDYEQELVKQKQRLIETLLKEQKVIDIKDVKEVKKEEEKDDKPSETQEQNLKDENGNVIGQRTINWYTNKEEKIDKIVTTGQLENEEGKYKLKEISLEKNGRLQSQMKGIKCYNKETSQDEQYIYQKNGKDNEYYRKIADGKLVFEIRRTEKGTIINNYDSQGKRSERYEYDQHGNGIVPIIGKDKLEENYIENFFELDMPQFEVEDIEKNSKYFINAAILAGEKVVRKSQIENQAKILEFRTKEKEQNQDTKEER